MTKPQKIGPTLKLLTLAALLAATMPQADAADDEVLEVYFIGNSLTMSTTLDRVHTMADELGVDLQYGSQVSGGKSLIRHLRYKDEPNQKWKSWETNAPSSGTFEPDENMYVDEPGEIHRFGLYDEALAGHPWDQVVFQLYGGSLHDDLEAITTFVDLALSNGNEPAFLIYSVWPRRPKERLDDGSIAVLNLNYQATWDRPYSASADDESKQASWDYYSRSYNDRLIGELEARYPSQTFRLVPVGEVVYRMDEMIQSGSIPGLEALAKRKPELLPGIDEDTGFEDGANILYADGHHFNPMPHQMDSLGIFISGTTLAAAVTGKSPVGLTGTTYGLDDTADAELIRTLQELILTTLKETPKTGF